MKPGVDISRWQGHKINWPVVAKQTDFAYLRIAYGLTADTAFSREWGLAKAVMNRLGVYQYLRPEQGARVQAEYLRELLSMAGSYELPPALDIEEGKPSVEDIELWLDVVELQTGRTPAIYGPYSFLQGLHLPAKFVRYPLWVADYSRPICKPRVPKPWTDFWVHQHSGQGTLAGVKGIVDLNMEKTQ